MKKSLIVAALLIAFSAQAKCYKSHKKSHSDWRLTDQMVRIENNDVVPSGNSLINRRTGDKLFLAKIKDEGSLEAISSACNSEGLTPIFQETSCSGETRTYVVRSGLCVENYITHNEEHLVREKDESIGFYPGRMIVWAFSVSTERLILLPFIAVAEVVVLPFSTLIAIEDINITLSRRVAQKRLKKLERKDVKISNSNMYYALKTLIQN